MYFLERAQIHFEKKAKMIAEQTGPNAPQYRFLDSLTDLELETNPFRHIVLDSFLPPKQYEACVRYYKEIAARGFAEGKDPARLAPFTDVEKPYDGYVYPVKPDDDPAVALFYSYTWNLFFSELFKMPTHKATSVGLHYHPAGDADGWVHSDYSLKQFHYGDTTRDGMLLEVGGDFPDGNGYRKLRRGIAFIYYLESELGDTSGGTGLFATLEGDPVRVVEPKANRLLAFEVSPHSLHAFRTNRFPRASFVQWLYADPRVGDARYKKTS